MYTLDAITRPIVPTPLDASGPIDSSIPRVNLPRERDLRFGRNRVSIYYEVYSTLYRFRTATEMTRNQLLIFTSKRWCTRNDSENTEFETPNENKGESIPPTLNESPLDDIKTRISRLLNRSLNRSGLDMPFRDY